MANTQQEAIAAGWNVALGSLVTLTSITPAGDEAFGGVESTPLYDPGIVKIDGNGNVFLQGYATAKWKLTRLTYLQWYYAYVNWGINSMSGPVTIYTPLWSQNGTYTRMNAILTLPKPPDMRHQYRYTEAEFTFTRLKVSS